MEVLGNRGWDRGSAPPSVDSLPEGHSDQSWASLKQGASFEFFESVWGLRDEGSGMDPLFHCETSEEWLWELVVSCYELIREMGILCWHLSLAGIYKDFRYPWKELERGEKTKAWEGKARMEAVQHSKKKIAFAIQHLGAGILTLPFTCLPEHKIHIA